MRKFKNKNRPKRKYTRHTTSQSSFQLSTIFVGLVPVFILAIAFLTTLLMNLNLREQTVSFQPQLQIPQFAFPQFTLPQFSLMDMIRPMQNLPNLFNQPLAFLSGVGGLALTGLQNSMVSLGYGIIWIAAFLDPRDTFVALGRGIQMFFIALGSVGISLLGGIVQIGELILQALSFVGAGIYAGATTIVNATIALFVWGASLVATGVVFLFEKIVWASMFLFNGIVGILTFLFMQLSAFVNAVINVILIPFQILGGFWLQVKPYFDILGVHMGMVGSDLANGFASFEELATEFNE